MAENQQQPNRLPKSAAARPQQAIAASIIPRLGLEFARYFSVSLAAFVVDLAIFSICIRWIGLPWVGSATVGFLFGLLVAYLLSIRFVFNTRALRENPAAELATFSAIGVGGLLVTQAILWVGIEWLRIEPELSKVAAAAFTVFFNFVARKIILFSSPTSHAKKPGGAHGKS